MAEEGWELGDGALSPLGGAQQSNIALRHDERDPAFLHRLRGLVLTLKKLRDCCHDDEYAARCCCFYCTQCARAPN